MNYLIKNGNIVLSDRIIKGDLLIRNDKISEISSHIKPHDDVVNVDAEDRYVIPAGIDAHVHMKLYTPADFSSDDFYSGSIAAYLGGTTSFIDFVTPDKNESLIKAIEKRFIDSQISLCDYALHMSITAWNDSVSDEMELCVKQYGIQSFKTYLAYKGIIGIDYNELEKVMFKAKSLNTMVTVHCEDGDEIIKRQKEFLQNGKTTPQFHALSRTSEVESDAVKRVIELAEKTGCTTYIVHTSSAESIKYITNAQNKGLKVIAETCPQYLILDDSVYEKSIEESLKYIISPPIRKKQDNEALWTALKNKNVSVVATDHCPFNTKGQKDIGISDFTKIPNGAGGIEHRLALLFTYGVLKNKISLFDWVELCSTNPAKLFGLYPRKGNLNPGSDADIVIWNPHIETIISKNTHHQNCDSNIYEGIKIKGQAETVFHKGEMVVNKGELYQIPKKGLYLYPINH